MANCPFFRENTPLSVHTEPKKETPEEKKARWEQERRRLILLGLVSALLCFIGMLLNTSKDKQRRLLDILIYAEYIVFFIAAGLCRETE